jgi:hypothetical protein
MEFFSPMPTIFYNNRFVKNILVHVKPTSRFLQESAIFYPYSINEAEIGSTRMEDIAFDYYGNSDDVWILYQINKVIDPYYDVYLDTRKFESFLKKKYETIEASLQKYIFWRNNYSTDDTIKTPAQYNVLSPTQKKFWTPVLGFNGDITSYIRHEDNFTYSTNKIVSVTGTASSAFTQEEKVTQATTGATGYVIFSNSTTLKLEHIQNGTFDATNIITGSESGETFTPTAGTLVTTQIIPADEEVYFSPVTLYDYEIEQNQFKKDIRIMDNSYQQMLHAAYLELVGE